MTALYHRRFGSKLPPTRMQARHNKELRESSFSTFAGMTSFLRSHVRTLLSVRNPVIQYFLAIASHTNDTKRSDLPIFLLDPTFSIAVHENSFESGTVDANEALAIVQ